MLYLFILKKFIFKINTDVVYNPLEVQFPTDVDTHGKIEKAGPTSAVACPRSRWRTTSARSTIESEPKKKTTDIVLYYKIFLTSEQQGG